MTKAEEVMLKKGYVSVAKAAEIAKHDISTIYRWIEKQKVEGTIAAGVHYVHEGSLREYLGPLVDSEADKKARK